MNPEPILFAHGNIAMPRIVDSLERAKQLAAEDARRSSTPQPVLAVDLHHPERPVTVLGHVRPDGSYQDLVEPAGSCRWRIPVDAYGETQRRGIQIIAPRNHCIQQ